MANIDFTSADGNIFPRFGKMGLVLSQMRTYQAAQVINLVGGNPPTGGPASLDGQFVSEPDVQALIGASWISILNSLAGGSTMQGLAEQTLNRIVYRANPRLAQTLTQLATTESLAEFLRQLSVQGFGVRAHDSIAATANTIGGNPATFFSQDDPALTPGNGAVVTSVRRPSDGVLYENQYAEDLDVLISADSFVGGATEFQEGYTVTGTGKQTDPFAFDWPLGSDGQVSGTSIDGRSSNGGGNILTNSGFDAFTANIPNQWERVTGTAGTHIFEETSLIFGTGKALRIAGDGSTLTQLRQKFGDSTNGTGGSLEPLTQYSFCIWARRDGTAPAAGQWIIDLVDQNGNVVNDAGTPGIANSMTIDLTALSTIYTPYTFMVRTPLVLPDTLYWRMRHPTGNALTNGRSVYFDLGGLGLTNQVYTGGLWVGVHSGSVLAKNNDLATITATNGRSGGSLNTFQTLLFRLFYPLFEQNEIIVPTRGTVVPDSLIG